MIRRRSAFTMVELLVVILIIAILIALLVPAVMSAVRAAKNAQVSSEIQALATALNSFKTAYSDFPPSRISSGSSAASLSSRTRGSPPTCRRVTLRRTARLRMRRD